MVDYQHEFHRRHGHKKTGLRWAVALINKLKATAWDMWEHRNSVRHGKEDDYHTRRVTAYTDNAIKAQFRKGRTRLLRRHKHLLQSLPTTLHLELMDKQRWLEAVAGARRAWKHKQDSMPNYDQERASITNWRRTGRCSGTAPPATDAPT